MPTELPPSPPPAILVIPPEGARLATAFGSHAEFKLEGRHTGHALCLGIAHPPPGALTGTGSAPGGGSVQPGPGVEP